MSRQRSTAGAGSAGFVLPLAPDEYAIGGKARSLARLRAIGLPVPEGFAIGVALFRALRANGPPLPTRLRSVADLASLDQARNALASAPFPAGFEAELEAALDAAERTAIPGFAQAAGSPAMRQRRWAVRSSAPDEDRPGAAAPGIYASLLQVPRAGTAGAVRHVLASFLTPAAWVYRAAETSEPDAGEGAPAGDAAVLVHAFVDGSANGTAALDPGASGASVSVSVPDDRPSAGAGAVTVDVRSGELSAGARAAIDRAARTAAKRYGPVELEWVARDDQVLFLQLRGYQPSRGQRDPSAPSDDSATDVIADAGWIWDAVHNPLPLSPAAAGLVELVDARCRIPVRQRVIGGYLFYRGASPDRSPRRQGDGPGVSFERLRAVIEPRLDALGPEPSLSDALDLFVAAYEPLFDVVAPACAAARRALTEFVANRLPGRLGEVSGLLAGVPSAATARRAAAVAIAAASGVEAREAAIEDYLRRFGDESARWDVAEPTLRETPARLLMLGAAGMTSTRPATTADVTADVTAKTESARVIQEDLGRTLTPPERHHLDALVATAREAVAVGEDDDALYARLQAGVRRALLGLGRRLVAAGRLDEPDDVFYLPLSRAQQLEGSPEPSSLGSIRGSDPGSNAGSDLRPIVATARQALRDAALSRPRPPRSGRRDGQVVRGLGGAGGRLVGRAVHHPPSAPLGADAVLIAATLLPTELPLLGPGAIVVETGEVLGHVAAQARERGIPAVVGATGACAAIPDGALVIVDGDRGEVIRLA